MHTYSSSKQQFYAHVVDLLEGMDLLNFGVTGWGLGLLPPDFPQSFPPDFDEQSCVNRSRTDQKRFY